MQASIQTKTITAKTSIEKWVKVRKRRFKHSSLIFKVFVFKSLDTEIFHCHDIKSNDHDTIIISRLIISGLNDHTALWIIDRLYFKRSLGKHSRYY